MLISSASDHPSGQGMALVLEGLGDDLVDSNFVGVQLARSHIVQCAH
jgi:hypothetical protein